MPQREGWGGGAAQPLLLPGSVILRRRQRMRPELAEASFGRGVAAAGKGPPAQLGPPPLVGVVSGVGCVRGAWRRVLCESVWLPAILRTLREPAAEEAAAE